MEREDGGKHTHTHRGDENTKGNKRGDARHESGDKGVVEVTRGGREGCAGSDSYFKRRTRGVNETEEN